MFARACAVLVGSVLAAVSLAGCSGVCAGDVIVDHPLVLDARAWFAAHPQTSIRVCVKNTCTTDTETARNKGWLSLDQPTGPAGTRATAWVTLLSGSTQLQEVSLVVTEKQNRCMPSPCGCIDTGASAHVRVGADGTVTAG